MPTISRFYGITILMFFDEKHGPHFHVEYGEYRAQVSILDGRVLAGRLPQRVYRLILEWWALHREELEDNWERARREQALKPVAPLD
jgi:hypothetical protein